MSQALGRYILRASLAGSFAVAGWAVGMWIQTNGFGAWVLWLLSTLLAPMLVGLILGRLALIPSLCFNNGVVLGIMYAQLRWEAAHKFDIWKSLAYDAWMIVEMLLIATATGFLCLLTAAVVREMAAQRRGKQ